jgi:thimet oligopeptidase
MRTGIVSLIAFVSLLVGCAGSTSSSQQAERAPEPPPAPTTPAQVQLANPTNSLIDFQYAADARRVRITIPEFEDTPGDIVAAVDGALATADSRLAGYVNQDIARADFNTAIARLDDIVYPVVNTTSRLYLIKETSTDPLVREAASEQVTRLEEWFVGLQYREDVYRVVKGFADAYEAGRGTRLRGENKQLFEETIRDYRRAGLALDAATRAKVEDLRKQLARVSSEFDTNITNADVTIEFTETQLDGVPEVFLANAPRNGDMYGLKPTVITHFLAVMNNATNEETRKAMKIARYSVAMEENASVLNEMVRLRQEIAALLGYDSWADYQIEPRMAKTADRATQFCLDAKEGLQPKFAEEMAQMRAMKVNDTGDSDAEIEIWDWRYYENQLKKTKYQVDAEAIRAYFPLNNCLAGMFDVYESIFGLTITQIENPQPWAEGVTLYVIADSRTGEPLGLFYLDLYPRQGKYNHFAQFGIIDGKLMNDGYYQRPTVALVCNFPEPTADAPSLLTHANLETLFHEFGHALHTILTRAKYVAFSGTSVPRDFVEAPSQMLENWAWDKGVLDSFAADYRDPSKKIPADLLARMEEAKLATIATFYRRQLALALGDLQLHTVGDTPDAESTINEAMAQVFLAVPAGTNFAAYWGHLSGYDAGYYGYAWADAIAADMATRFTDAPNGLMDKRVGMALRNEVYSVGGSRDVEISIEEFLGRSRSNDAFYESLGISESSK